MPHKNVEVQYVHISKKRNLSISLQDNDENNEENNEKIKSAKRYFLRSENNKVASDFSKLFASESTKKNKRKKKCTLSKNEEKVNVSSMVSNPVEPKKNCTKKKETYLKRQNKKEVIDPPKVSPTPQSAEKYEKKNKNSPKSEVKENEMTVIPTVPENVKEKGNIKKKTCLQSGNEDVVVTLAPAEKNRKRKRNRLQSEFDTLQLVEKSKRKNEDCLQSGDSQSVVYIFEKPAINEPAEKIKKKKNDCLYTVSKRIEAIASSKVSADVEKSKMKRKNRMSSVNEEKKVVHSSNIFSFFKTEEKNKYREKDCLQSENNEEEVVCLSKETAISEPVGITVPAPASFTSSENQNGDVSGRTCVICMDSEESSPFTVMPCDHSCHSMCLQTWLHLKKSCPICAPYSSENNSFRQETAGHTVSECNEVILCVVCMNSIKSPDLEIMSCGHTFHDVCAHILYQESNSCPACMPDFSVSVNTSNILAYEKTYGIQKQVQCVICLDTVESSDFQYITCCHSFHIQCIQTWFGISELCPICMAKNSSSILEDAVGYEFFEDVKCKICMDIEISSDFQQLSCNHNFHSTCLQSWMEDNKTCPTCKRDIHVNGIAEQNSEDVRCAICVDTEESTIFEFLPCCHSFHTKCIQSWLKKRHSCPICKTAVPVNDGRSGALGNRNTIPVENERVNGLNTHYNIGSQSVINTENIDRFHNMRGTLRNMRNMVALGNRNTIPVESERVNGLNTHNNISSQPVINIESIDTLDNMSNMIFELRRILGIFSERRRRR